MSSDNVQENKKVYSLVVDEDVKKALEAKCGPKANLRSWEFSDFTSKGDNYACIVTSIIVYYTQNARNLITTFVVKLNPRREFNFADSSFYAKEGLIYLQVIPAMNKALASANQPPIKVPKCYYCNNTPEKEVIYFEDLREHGFKMTDRKKGLDVPHVTMLLEELGRFHSASLLLKQGKTKAELIEQFPCLEESFLTSTIFENPKLADMFNQILTSTSQILGSSEKYKKVAEIVKGLDFYKETFPQLESEPPFQVICHGDCWNNNFVFKYDDNGIPCDVRFLDLQVVRVGSVGLDLNYLLYSSVVGDIRKKHLPVLLAGYRSSFCAVMASSGQSSPFSEEELMAEFRKKNKFGMMMAFMLIPAIIAQDGDIPDMEEFHEENMEEKMAEYTENMAVNPLIKPRLFDMIDEMIECGVVKL